MSQTPLQWGILGTAKIAREKVIPAIHIAKLSQVQAVASRQQGKAEKYALENGIPFAFEDYQALLDKPEIDAVYIPLPNHLHTPWAIKAIMAGKHVLCEKPISLTAQEIEELINVSAKHPQVKVMEAFMYRFHPQWDKAKALIQAGTIGKVHNIKASFTYFNRDPANVRNQASIGGGGLMDIGCYCISACRFLFDSEPKRVMGTLSKDEEFGTDKHADGILEFDLGDGETGNGIIHCSTQSEASQRVTISGETGTIVINSPFYQVDDKPARILIFKNREKEVIEFPPCNQYVNQVEQFSKAIIENLPVPTPLTDALANMKVIDNIVASDSQNSWIAG